MLDYLCLEDGQTCLSNESDEFIDAIVSLVKKGIASLVDVVEQHQNSLQD